MIKYKKISGYDASEKNSYILDKYLPFPTGTLGLISSRGGVGKTMLSIKIAMEYAKDNKYTTGKKACCWFTEDDGNTIQKRALSLCKTGIHTTFENINDVILIEDDPVHFVTVNNGKIVTNMEKINELFEFCKFENIGLLIIDPLLAFFGGSENDNAQARSFMQPFINFCTNEGVNVIFLHHSSKNLEGGTRGAGAFVDAVRTSYEIDFKKIKKDGVMVAEPTLYFEGMREITLKKDNRNVSYLLNKINKTEVFTNKFLYKIIPSGEYKIDEEIKTVKELFSDETELKEFKVKEPIKEEILKEVIVKTKEYNEEENMERFSSLIIEKSEDSLFSSLKKQSIKTKPTYDAIIDSSKQIETLIKMNNNSKANEIINCDKDIDLDLNNLPF